VPGPGSEWGTSLWGGTNLGSRSQSIDFGGEVCPADGSLVTGQMGSGQLAAQGSGKAAFQTRITYIRQPYQQGADFALTPASLQPIETNPNYYTINIFNDPIDGTSFCFGGPSGA